MSSRFSRASRVKLLGLGVIAVTSAYLVHQWKFRDGARLEGSGRPLTDAERTEIQQALERGREKAQAADAGWRAAMDSIASKNILGDRDSGDCPIHVPLHAASEKNPPLWLNRIKEENLAKAKSAWGNFYAEQSKEITKAIAVPQTNEKIASLLGDANRTKLLDMEWEVAFVLDVDNEPKYSFGNGPTGGKQYWPGMMAGNVYIYDYRTKKIECAANIVVENAPSIKFEYKKMIDPGRPDLNQGRVELEQALRRDLLEMMYLKLSSEIRYQVRAK